MRDNMKLVEVFVWEGRWKEANSIYSLLWVLARGMRNEFQSYMPSYTVDATLYRNAVSTGPDTSALWLFRTFELGYEKLWSEANNFRRASWAVQCDLWESNAFTSEMAKGKASFTYSVRIEGSECWKQPHGGFVIASATWYDDMGWR